MRWTKNICLRCWSVDVDEFTVAKRCGRKNVDPLFQWNSIRRKMCDAKLVKSVWFDSMGRLQTICRCSIQSVKRCLGLLEANVKTSWIVERNSMIAFDAVRFGRWKIIHIALCKQPKLMRRKFSHKNGLCQFHYERCVDGFACRVLLFWSMRCLCIVKNWRITDVDVDVVCSMFDAIRCDRWKMHTELCMRLRWCGEKFHKNGLCRFYYECCVDGLLADCRFFVRVNCLSAVKKMMITFTVNSQFAFPCSVHELLMLAVDTEFGCFNEIVKPWMFSGRRCGSMEFVAAL